jgi:hypothetical protein
VVANVVDTAEVVTGSDKSRLNLTTVLFPQLHMQVSNIFIPEVAC